MGSVCPFIKEACLGKECFMWNDEHCLIRAHLEKSVFGAVQTADPSGRSAREKEKERIMSELDALSPEDLQGQLFDFARTRFTGDASVSQGWGEMFLKSKNDLLSNRDLSSNTNAKFEEARRLAESRLSEERNLEREERYKREKAALPGLVDACVEWSRQRGLKKLSESDIDVFLAERNAKILMEIKRLLHTTVSFKLKSII